MSVRIDDGPELTSPIVRPRSLRMIAVYLALVVVPVALIWFTLRHGLSATGRPAGGPATPSVPDVFPRLLIAIPVILAACHLCGRLFRRLAQPPVIGEIIAGVLLGPSVLGALWPAGYATLFPPGLVSTLSTLSQVGLIFFMFLVGYELDLDLVRQRSYTAAVISHVSIVVPFLCGVLLALALYPVLGSGGVGQLAFTLFFGISMSITAFPVLARILSDRGMSRTPVGVMSLTCAAVDDVTAWCVLAAVVAVTRSAAADVALVTAGMSVGFFAVMAFGVRPLLRRLLGPGGLLPEAAVLPVALAGLMLSALATDAIGIHSIFGAFLFGAIMPRGSLPVRRAAGQLHGLTVTLLLPLFFVYTGLHTEFGLLGADGRLWAWCLLITAVAVLAKAGGSTTAARVSGIGWRDSLSLGVLMNCRGLTELVVLNIGMSMGVISPTVFTMLVFMTLVSTVMTAPCLDLLRRLRRDS
ncbi:cation:proton antiporter [Nonomuraea sp. NPDC050022]|uniref:cation:proton antiporter n=1 Tax=unclassified Nonomuraea TaxID=2593643 RepID=UPI0033E86791